MGQLRKRSPVIILIEPHRLDTVTSGGYRYQACVFEHLKAEQGRKIASTSRDLQPLIDRLRREEPQATIVVDGLFAELRAKPLPSGTIALLHMVPTRSNWCEQPMHVLATSATTAAAVAGQSRSTTVVRPGLDVCFDQERMVRKPDGAVQVLCVGTISAAKGQARLVRMLQQMKQPWQLALIGSYDPDDEELLRVRQHGEGLPIALHGSVSIQEIAYRFARADLLVSLSRSESFGMAVAEAAAAGLPVLALATGELDSFIHNGKNGWLLPNDVDDQDIQAHLQDLLITPSKLEAARAARTRPPLADWKDVAQRFVAACNAAHGSP
ncbi:MAG: glycosyltransferase involved in cell wall biosynthesis [Planctomycetota bacterium]|jgi:glycosyltransferase involved in cell wall biosynthesis